MAKPSTALLSRAIASIDRILGDNSELKELWEDSEEWPKGVNELVVLTLLSLIVLAGLGFYDDYAKITKQNNLGTTSLIKLSSGASTSLMKNP